MARWRRMDSTVEWERRGREGEGEEGGRFGGEKYRGREMVRRLKEEEAVMQ
jgi:hypothetical protein